MTRTAANVKPTTLALAVACSLAALAEADDLRTQVIECGAIADSKERIACYDRIVRLASEERAADDSEVQAESPQPRSASANPVREETPRLERATRPSPEEIGTVQLSGEQPAQPNEQTANRNSPGARAAANPRSDEIRATPRSAPTQRAIEGFGADKLTHGSEERLERIVSAIVRIRKLSRGNYLLTLDNGQRWREIEYDRYTRYAVGDRVEIRRGRLGTYDLISQATGHRNKVRRVE